jgi:hypothetical protein
VFFQVRKFTFLILKNDRLTFFNIPEEDKFHRKTTSETARSEALSHPAGVRIIFTAQPLPAHERHALYTKSGNARYLTNNSTHLMY